MGAYTYCRCGRAMNKATFSEALYGEAECEHCGGHRPVDEFEKKLVVDEFMQRIDDLEHAVRELNKKLPKEEGL